jgi:hypothetical protein
MTLAALGQQLDYDALLSVLNIKSWGTPHRNIQQLSTNWERNGRLEELATWCQAPLIEVKQA